MESGVLTFVLLSFSAVHSWPIDVTDWDDAVVAQVGTPTTLNCTHSTTEGAVTIRWMLRLLDEDVWKLIFSVNERKETVNVDGDKSMRLADPNFQDTGDFSLLFYPKKEDSGFYLCSIKQHGWKVKERMILLAFITVTVAPPQPVPEGSILRLIAKVKPEIVARNITWVDPDGLPMKSERRPNTGTVAKQSQITQRDSGSYHCLVHPWSNNSVFKFTVHVTVDDQKNAKFSNTLDGAMIYAATSTKTPLILACPKVKGDFVILHWQPPDAVKHNMKLVYQYDRWTGESMVPGKTKKLWLTGSPVSAVAGSFAFTLSPEVVDGGLYSCDVYLNDDSYTQWTQLSVLKVKAKPLSSALELLCVYSQRNQVQSAKWRHSNKSVKLPMQSTAPGSLTTTIRLPITPDTAGNYTCTIVLNNGQTASATHTVALPPAASGRDTSPSLLPALSALLLLVPLVTAAVIVFLWRQKHISVRGVEQSLSVRSGEAENIYENPEDIRQQAPPQGSVYMDLKPRGEDDVYKELERYE